MFLDDKEKQSGETQGKVDDEVLVSTHTNTHLHTLTLIYYAHTLWMVHESLLMFSFSCFVNPLPACCDQVRALLSDSYGRAKKLLETHRKELDLVAQVTNTP